MKEDSGKSKKKILISNHYYFNSKKNLNLINN